MCQDERIKEACGVFGIYNPHGEDAASPIYYGLSSLQHRGQESCGIAVSETDGPKGKVTSHKGMGLVRRCSFKYERKSRYRACPLFHNRGGYIE